MTSTPASAFCTRCFSEDLPLGQICHRSEVFDYGVDHAEDVNRYQGTCLRCCDHNHG